MCWIPSRTADIFTATIMPLAQRGSSGTGIRHHVRTALLTAAYRHSISTGCPMHALRCHSNTQPIKYLSSLTSTPIQASHTLLHRHKRKTIEKPTAFRSTPHHHLLLSASFPGSAGTGAERTTAPTLSSPALSSARSSLGPSYFHSSYHLSTAFPLS